MKTTLAERLKIAMTAPPPKVTGKALAHACGIKPPSVSDWLSGKSKTMEGSNLLAAADFLNVRPKWLADGVGSMRSQKEMVDFLDSIKIDPITGKAAREPTIAYLPERKLDKMSEELLDLFGQLDETGKREGVLLLKGFVAGRRPHTRTAKLLQWPVKKREPREQKYTHPGQQQLDFVGTEAKPFGRACDNT